MIDIYQVLRGVEFSFMIFMIILLAAHLIIRKSNKNHARPL